MSRKGLYRTNAGDKAIIQRSVEEDNPNIFLNYYLRNNDSGTWFRPVSNADILTLQFPETRAAAQKWQDNYNLLSDIWDWLGRPYYFAPSQNSSSDWGEISPEEYDAFSIEGMTAYRVVWQPDVPGKPVFHHRHGAILLDWQMEMTRNRAFTQVVVGGYGCIAPETRIYDFERNEHVPVEQLVEENRAPVVLAWTGAEFVPIRATVPWKKGVAKLYRIRVESGREIVVTEHHRFLSDSGWVSLSSLEHDWSDLHLHLSDADRPPSSQVLAPSVSHPDEQRWTQTTQGFQYDCPMCRRFDDAQLHSGASSALDVLPLRGDAPEHNRASSRVGGQGAGVGYSHPYLSSFRRANSHSAHLSDHLAWQHLSHDYARSGVTAPSSLSLFLFPMLQGYDGYSYPAMPFPLSGHGMAQSDYHFVSACETPIGLKNQKSRECGLERVVLVELVGEGDYYDLHVPVYENYLAEGFINHNSGKTWAKALGMLWRAATLPGYRAFALAPYAIQSTEVYKQLLLAVQETLFAERFLMASPTKPFPMLMIGNDLVGNNSIECYPILDDPGKLLTLTGDEALLDQAEKMENGTLADTIGKVASRFRGQIRGRPRRGQITLVANSADNPELWDYYDDAATDPDIWAYSPGTFENEYLTVADLKRFEKQVGRDEQSKRMYLFGERPLGSGEHFPRQSLEQCRARELDEIIRFNVDTKVAGWVLKRAQKVDIYSYRMPYEQGGRYIVAADPGWGNPPERNSAVIAVWRIDGFPKLPAQLVAFEWVFGNGQPTPWMAMYRELVGEYRAIGLNGFDATGPQAGYERMEDFSDLQHTPVSMAGTKKYIYLNLAKKLFATSKFLIPTIPHLFSQLAKYKLPDDKIRQDIVSMILVTAALLEPYMYISEHLPADDRNNDPNDRYQREEYLHESLEERY